MRKNKKLHFSTNDVIIKKQKRPVQPFNHRPLIPAHPHPWFNKR